MSEFWKNDDISDNCLCPLPFDLLKSVAKIVGLLTHEWLRFPQLTEFHGRLAWRYFYNNCRHRTREVDYRWISIGKRIRSLRKTGSNSHTLPRGKLAIILLHIILTGIRKSHQGSHICYWISKHHGYWRNDWANQSYFIPAYACDYLVCSRERRSK